LAQISRGSTTPRMMSRPYPRFTGSVGVMGSSPNTPERLWAEALRAICVIIPILAVNLYNRNASIYYSF